MSGLGAVNQAKPKRGRIRYPVAKGPAGECLDVKAYRKGTPATCFGCGKPMTAHQGRIAWHFQHSVGVDSYACDGETALHACAKHLIAESFEAARKAGAPYPLTWPCERCALVREWDLCRTWTAATLESQLTRGTQADVALTGSAGPLAIEVVVTHEIEDATAAAYAEAGVRVAVVRPQWNTLLVLRDKVSAARVLGKGSVCDPCRERIRRQAEEVERARLERIEVRTFAESLRTRPVVEGEPFTLCQVDASGQGYGTRDLERLHECATRLSRLGFRQTTGKPWLYVAKLSGGVAAFASLGARKYMRPGAKVWVDARRLNARPEFSALLNAVLEAWCKAGGVQLREPSGQRWEAELREILAVESVVDSTTSSAVTA